MSGKIIVFSGYAGAGKNTVINELMSRISGFTYIPSVTTREKRTGESEGNPYFFKTLGEFLFLKESGKFIETENIHGNWYGTLSTKYEDFLKEDKIILKDIGVEGALKFKEFFGESVCLIFIKPSNDFTVLDRMKARGDSLEDICNRKKRIYYESSFIKHFDSIVINDDLDYAVDKSEEIIKNFLNKNRGEVI